MPDPARFRLVTQRGSPASTLASASIPVADLFRGDAGHERPVPARSADRRNRLSRRRRLDQDQRRAERHEYELPQQRAAGEAARAERAGRLASR